MQLTKEQKLAQIDQQLNQIKYEKEHQYFDYINPFNSVKDIYRYYFTFLFLLVGTLALYSEVVTTGTYLNK